MKINIPILIGFLLLMILLFMNQCSDESTSPDLEFEGITVTDSVGNVESIDPNDWCGELTSGTRSEIPTAFALYPAFPNPTSTKTNITYDLPVASHVIIRIYASSRKVITELANRTHEAGRYETVWDVSGVAPGIYDCWMGAGDFECRGNIKVE